MLNQRVLRDVGILELIHQHMMEALGVFFAHIGMFFEQVGGHQQQVVEIHAVGLLEQFLVFFVDAFHGFVAVGFDGEIVRADQFVLGARNRPVDDDRAIEFVVEIEFLDGCFDHLFLVVGVEDDKLVVDRQPVRLAAQDAGAGGVESAEQQAARHLLAEQLLDAVFHFAGGFVGESDGQHLVGARALVAN